MPLTLHGNQEEENLLKDGRKHMTLNEMADKEAMERKMMAPLNHFFKRVSELAAETLVALSKDLRITSEVQELIWAIIRVTLSQESSMLVGRHLD